MKSDSVRKNIDFFHIATAYEVMNKWLDNQTDKSVSSRTNTNKEKCFICTDTVN